eukprot:scaffold128943_cov31-Prasinocladus_malaysianus.AAC.1
MSQYTFPGQAYAPFTLRLGFLYAPTDVSNKPIVSHIWFKDQGSKKHPSQLYPASNYWVKMQGGKLPKYLVYFSMDITTYQALISEEVPINHVIGCCFDTYQDVKRRR